MGTIHDRSHGAGHSAQGGGPSGAMARLGRDAADLVRQEAARTRSDLLAAMRGVGMGSGLLAAAGLCGALAVVAAHETMLSALEKVMPRAAAAALLTTGYALGAGALAAAGWARLQEAGSDSSSALEAVRRDMTQPGGGPGPSA